MTHLSRCIVNVQELQQQAPLRPLTGDKFEACVVCSDRASGLHAANRTQDFIVFVSKLLGFSTK